MFSLLDSRLVAYQETHVVHVKIVPRKMKPKNGRVFLEGLGNFLALVKSEFVPWHVHVHNFLI